MSVRKPSEILKDLVAAYREQTKWQEAYDVLEKTKCDIFDQIRNHLAKKNELSQRVQTLNEELCQSAKEGK